MLVKVLVVIWKRISRTVLKKDLLTNNNISVGGFKFADGPGMPDVVVNLRAVQTLVKWHYLLKMKITNWKKYKI